MSQSIPYQMSQAVFAALEAALAADDVKVRDNPRSLAGLSEGKRVVFIEDWEDAPTTKPGQAEGRTFAIDAGVINRTADDRAGADADMLAVKQILTDALVRAGRELVKQKELTTFAAPREGVRRYRIDGIDVGGALIVTRFEIDYRTPAAANQR